MMGVLMVGSSLHICVTNIKFGMGKKKTCRKIRGRKKHFESILI